MMNNCCEEQGNPPKKSRKVNSNVINFASLSPEAQQAFANFQLKERHRHLDDIENIDKDLAIMEQHYSIKPQSIFVNTWLAVKKGTPL